MKMKSVNGNDQATNGFYALLNYPALYSLFQRIVGSRRKYLQYINDYIRPWENIRILDIGCGTADILTYLPEHVVYVGYDISSQYINYAKKKYGERAKFVNERVNAITLDKHESFDIVLADGLLHHLNDEEAKMLFQIGYAALNNEGFMLTVDPTFVEGQGTIDRYVTSMDRGRHVRSPQEYVKIAQQVYPHVDWNTMLFKMIVPLSGCILKCYRVR